jgi:predicted membrane-bound mannosyltransferase/DNA-binding beta-propeller fold protein YncE
LAETALGNRLYAPLRAEGAVDWLVAHKELVALGTLMLLAGVLRFWDLGAMALHHDESLHARYTWLLYDGQGYQHNPLMHGPFLFHSGALSFFLFGATDATTRFVPALFGVALVGMPYLLRKQIGMPAVLIAAVLLTFSPTLLYFSRFFRNDIYLAVWSLAMVICVWRYLDEEKDRYLYALAAVMAFSFATKEVTFITVAIFLVFLDLMFAIELGKRFRTTVHGSRFAREPHEKTSLEVFVSTALFAPWAWLIAALVPVFPNRILGYAKLPPVGDVLMLIGLLALPQFAAAIQVLPFVTNHGYAVDEENTLRVVTVIALLVIMAYGGLLWRPKLFFIAAACFFVPYVLLYTTFFTNQPGPWTSEFWHGHGGFFSGIWGSLDYWLDQHHVKRGNQPGYYYALLTPLYEFLPLLIAFAGAAWLLVRGDALRRWFLFWLVATFLGLTLAGEKMPWLETHIALPLALVASLVLAKALDVLEINGRRWLSVAGAAATAAFATVLVVEGDGVVQFIGVLAFAGLGGWLIACLVREPPSGFLKTLPRALAATELHVTVVIGSFAAVALALLSVVGAFGVDQYAAVWAAAVLPVALIGYVVAHLMTSSKAFGRGVLAVAVAALLTLTIRASFNASFNHEDTPVEMLVYTQTSPELPKIRDRIDALASASGLGYNLPIVVDNADSFAWPWAWYLRDYHEVAFLDLDEDYEPPPNAVLLINRSNTGLIDETRYAAAPYKHRWWFNETYRGLSFKDATEKGTSLDGLESLGAFFLNRRPAAGNTGSVDAVAYFPLTLSAFDTAPGPVAEPRPPVTLADGRIVLGTGSGEAGSAPGEFREPAGLYTDAEGNLWVADAHNNRVQEFDAEGSFLAQIDNAGAAPGGLTEPWSVAVDAEGSVYVADTWNHRIQKFGADLALVKTWGQPGESQDDPLVLFGPRDVAVAGDGTLWVTDTGNNRVLHFTADGEPLDAVSAAGAGSFNEPVGVVLQADGELLVTDAWSGRILRYEAQPPYGYLGEIDAGWTSHEILHKPYATVLSDGRILVSSPETGRLLLFTAQGEEIGTWQPLQGSVPVGVTAMPEGGFAFSDIARNEIQIVPADLIDGFFR